MNSNFIVLSYSICRREQFLREQALHEKEVEDTLQHLRNQLRSMEEQHRAQLTHLEEFKLSEIKLQVSPSHSFIHYPIN